MVFRHGPVDPSQTRLTSTTGSAIKKPNGIEWHDAIVTLRDAWGNLVNSVTDQVNVTLTLTGAGATAASGFPLTGKTTDGVFTARIVSASPVAAKVTGMAGGNQILTSSGTQAVLNPTFDWDSGPCDDPSKTWFTLNPAGPIVAGQGAYTVTAHLAQCDGTLMTGVESRISAVAPDAANPGTTYAAAVTEFTPTGIAGEYSAEITSLKAGTKQVSVAWDAALTTKQDIKPKNPPARTTVVFTASPVVDWNASHFNVSLGDKTADGTAQHTATVTLQDANANPILDAGNRIHASSVLLATAQPNVATIGSFEPTGTPGVYAAAITSLLAGTHQVTVTVDKVPSSQGSDTAPLAPGGNRDAVFVAGAAGWAKLTVTPSGSQPVGTGSFTLSVQVLDRANGNPVSGASVGFAIPSAVMGQPALGAASALTNASGIAQTTVTSTKSGAFPVQATVAGLTVVGSGTESVTFTPGAVDLTGSRLWTDDTGARLANGIAYFTVRARIVDSYGNPVPGTLLSFAANGSGQVTSTDPTSAQTNADGEVSARVVGNSPGASTVTAKAQTASGMQNLVDVLGVPQQVALMFVAGTVDQGNSFFTLPTAPGSKVAGNDADPHKVVAWLYDAAGKPIDLCLDAQGKPSTCQFSDLLATAGGPEGAAVVSGFRKATADEVAPSQLDGSQYTALITSKTAGSKVVVPSYAGITLNARPSNPTSVLFVAGDPSQATSSFTVSQTANVVANGTDTQTATITIKDANGNGVPGLSSALQVTAPPAVAGPVQLVDGQVGVYKVALTSTVAGAHAVSVTLTTPSGPMNISVSGSRDAVFVAGAPSASKSKLVVAPTTQEVSKNMTATITLRDAFSNLVAAGHSIDLTLVPTPGSPGVGNSWSPKTDAQGQAVVTFTSYKASTYTVHAAIAATSLEVT
ncbi:MAG: Ig-like domain-containing protein, partial [Micrococcales bacterium]|nr:Ig-like domain-containing protein [Micrococcales bacterium]